MIEMSIGSLIAMMGIPTAVTGFSFWLLAHRIQNGAGKHGCNGRAKKWFYLMRFAHKHFPPMEPDYGYWENNGWHKSGRPWNI